MLRVSAGTNKEMTETEGGRAESGQPTDYAMSTFPARKKGGRLHQSKVRFESIVNLWKWLILGPTKTPPFVKFKIHKVNIDRPVN